MAEQSMFFDSTETVKRPVTGQLLAMMHSMMIGGNGTGIAQEEGYTPFVVTPKQNMTLTLGKGAMFIKGYLYYNDRNLDLTLDAADPNLVRIDRIVIQFNNNPTEREIKAIVKKGTPSSSPEPPAMERTEMIYEMSVAQIVVIAGKSFIEENEIIDEKSNTEVSGYSPLHNLLRGVIVNETGNISMLNQSFISTTNSNPFTVQPSVHTLIPFGTVLKDTQQESSNNVITVKETGVYLIWLLFGTNEGELPNGADLQFFTDINGTLSNSIGVNVATHTRDNLFIGTTFESLNKGDQLSFYVNIFGLSSSIQARNNKIRITKIG
jgi:hypothetical protein